MSVTLPKIDLDFYQVTQSSHSPVKSQPEIVSYVFYIEKHLGMQMWSPNWKYSAGGNWVVCVIDQCSLDDRPIYKSVG